MAKIAKNETVQINTDGASWTVTSGGRVLGKGTASNHTKAYDAAKAWCDANRAKK